MKPYPFEALNHFTVPCSFTATYLELNCFASLGRVSWLLLTANAPNSQDRDAFVPAKMPQTSWKQRLLNGSKR